MTLLSFILLQLKFDEEDEDEDDDDGFTDRGYKVLRWEGLNIFVFVFCVPKGAGGQNSDSECVV